MPDVPAVCDTCGTVFSSGIYAENATIVTLVGNTAGPCPRCGGMGHVPDGTFTFTENTIELLQGPQRTVSELQSLAEILRQARERHASTEEVAETIRRESPQLTRLADLLPRTRSELYGFIQIVLAIIAIVLTQAAAQRIDIQEVDVDIDQVISITFQQQIQQRASESQTQQIPKVGRNELCPCGSGKKYKKCHGNPLSWQEN